MLSIDAKPWSSRSDNGVMNEASASDDVSSGAKSAGKNAGKSKPTSANPEPTPWPSSASIRDAIDGRAEIAANLDQGTNRS
jgi:hypothetical protein